MGGEVFHRRSICNALKNVLDGRQWECGFTYSDPRKRG